MMKSKLYTCSDEFLIEFKTNFSEKYVDLYINKDKDGILKLFKSNTFETDLEFDKPELDLMNTDDSNVCFYNNVKKIYTSLNFLTSTQASSEAFWFCLLHIYYLDYLFNLIDDIVTNTKNSRENIIDKLIIILFFKKKNGPTRSLLIQEIARLWWIGYRTYDENNEDPFHLTNYFCKNNPKGKAVAFFSSKLTNNSEYCLGVMDGVKEYIDNGIMRQIKESYTLINEHFNFVGGVRIIDIMTREQVKSETIRYLFDLINDPSLISDKKWNDCFVKKR